MTLVRERIADGRVLGLIEGFLKQGVIEGMDWQEAKGEGTPQGGVISPLLANIYLDPLDWLMAGFGFEMVRPKSLRKLRESIKPKTRRNNGKSMDAIVAGINRTLKGWFGYFKHVHPSELGEIDQWLRMRLRSILRKRRGGRGRGRGQDHHRWPNRYFTGLGLFCLLDAKVLETTSLPQGVNH